MYYDNLCLLWQKNKRNYQKLNCRRLNLSEKWKIHTDGLETVTFFFQYSLILTLCGKDVNKFGFVIGLIIAIGAMLVIPNPIGQLAKASTCSVSIGAHEAGTITVSGSTSGSCSGGGAIMRSGFGITSVVQGPHGDSKSSCTSTSVSQSEQGHDGDDSNGAVSCSSHAP